MFNDYQELMEAKKHLPDILDPNNDISLRAAKLALMLSIPNAPPHVIHGIMQLCIEKAEEQLNTKIQSN